MAKTEEKKRVGKIKLRDMRGSFVFVFDPKPGMLDKETGKLGAPSYQATFLIPKSTPEGKAMHKEISAVIEEVKKEKYGKDVPKYKPEKLCLRDGDLEDYDGYADHWYISCSNPAQPVLVDRDRSVLTKDNGGPAKIYSGAFMNPSLRIWAQDNDYGRRINCSLEGIQFFRKGEAFGAKPIDPNEEFDDLSDDDSDLVDITEDEDDSGLV